MLASVRSRALFIALVSALAIAIAGCGSTGGGPTSSSASTSSPPTSASPTSPAPTSTSPSPTPTSAFEFVADGLERPGFQDVLVTSVLGSTIVGAVRTKSAATGIDVGLVYSTDGGATWAWGGTLKLPGEQDPRGIMLTPQGAVVVGQTRAGEADPKAFIAAAAAPAFDLFQVQLPKEFSGPVSLRSVAAYKGDWIIVGLGIDGGDFATLIWRSGDQGATWTRRVVALPEVMAAEQLVVGPDGSWNMVGATRTRAAWARSEDAGATWTFVQPKAFASGSVAFEFQMTDARVVVIRGQQGGEAAIWASNADGAMTLMPLPDPTVTEALFHEGQLLTVGAPDAHRIKFWALVDGNWKVGPAIESDQQIYPDQAVSVDGSVVVIGNVATGGDRNIGIWRGTLLPVV